MLLSAMSVLVVVQSSLEIPEGLMNNRVYQSGESPTLLLQHPELSSQAYLLCFITI